MPETMPEIGGVDQPAICDHEYVNRPESDTWFCMWCGEER